MPSQESQPEAAPRSVLHPLSRTLLLLTVTTGVVDAVSYLGLGRVFTANMTGNIVLLGFGLAQSGHLPVVAPIVSIAAFVVGSGAGGVLALRLGDRQPAQLAGPLAIEVALIAIAAVLAAVIQVRPLGPSGDVVIALLALAMGVRNATVRRIAVPDLTTTVLTMTITGLAADSRLFGGTGKGSTRRTAAVVSMLAGAVAGALLLRTRMWVALLAAAALGLATLAAYMQVARARA